MNKAAQIRSNFQLNYRAPAQVKNLLLFFIPSLSLIKTMETFDLKSLAKPTWEFPESLIKFVSENILSQARNRPIFFNPASNPEEIIRGSLLPYLPILGISVPFASMYEEARKLEHLAVSHRDEYGEHRGWKSLVIHGLGPTKTQGAEHYGLDPKDQNLYRWTEIADMCPLSTDFFKFQLHYQNYQRVRFMYLEPGGYIEPHIDVEEIYLGPLNIALNNPDGCKFIISQVGEVPFAPGSLNKLTVGFKHAVVNTSSQTRIHVIVHGHMNMDYWKNLLISSYRSLIYGPNSNRFLAN